MTMLTSRKRSRAAEEETTQTLEVGVVLGQLNAYAKRLEDAVGDLERLLLEREGENPDGQSDE